MPRRSRNGLAAAPRTARSPSTISVLNGPKIEIQHARMAEHRLFEERRPASLESPSRSSAACHRSARSITCQIGNWR
eukprot:308940-Pyramimonas_sp.AAC.1